MNDSNHDGIYEFECQHGEAECRAGITEACLMDKMSNDFGLVPLIACIEATNDPSQLNSTRQVRIPALMSKILHFFLPLED